MILAVTLHRLLLALDYLHTECKVIHTGIYIHISRSASSIHLLTMNAIRY